MDSVMDNEHDTTAALAVVQQCLANVSASSARQTTSPLSHLASLYVPETASLGKTRVIVTLLWCSGLLCSAYSYLVGYRHCDTHQGQQARQTTIRLAEEQQGSTETMSSGEDVMELATDT